MSLQPNAFRRQAANSSESSADLGHQWRDWLDRLIEGDEKAAAAFWQKYGERLKRLAARQLTPRLQRRVTAEDVVQSAFRTFWRRVQNGQFEITSQERIWRLLCVITLAKVRGHARFHQRDKRTINKERPLQPCPDDSRFAPFQIASREPTPAEMAQFADQLQRVLDVLDPDERKLLNLKLEDHTNREISVKLKCSERTVRRILTRLRSRLSSMLREDFESCSRDS